MKTAFFEVEPWEKDYLSKKFHSTEVLFFSEKLLPENAGLAKECEAVSVFIYSKVGARTLKLLPRLKLIATRSTGVDHIDLRECSMRKVLVANVPSYGENTVAEHAFALMLSLSRNIHKAYEKTIRGDFSHSGLRGFDLQGKTLGIVGMGRIGQHVARIAQGFEMRVLAFDLHPIPAIARKLGFKYSPMARLLRESDIVTLHLPYLKSTHHIIGEENLSRMKQGAILINTARGGLVDTKALARSLLSGRLGGAGLDVLEEEGLIKEEAQLLARDYSKKTLETLVRDHVIISRTNTIITPHIAFDSKEAVERILATTAANISSFARGKPVNLVR